jgi:hypothetical protein
MNPTFTIRSTFELKKGCGFAVIFSYQPSFIGVIILFLKWDITIGLEKKQ